MSTGFRNWSLNWTEAEHKEFLRKVCGQPRRTLEGDEYDQVTTLLLLVDPISVSNNQDTLTEVYRLGNTEYHVIYGGWEHSVIDVMMEDEDV